MRHVTIYIADGDATIEVEPSPVPVAINAGTLIITAGTEEIEVTLAEDERRDLIRALGGRL